MRALTTIGLLGTMFFLSLPVGAQQKAKPPKPKAAAAGPTAVDVAPAVKKLESGDDAQIKQALDELRIAGPGGAAAAPAIAKALSRGLTLPLTESAIETLADLEAEAGSSAVASYVQHRNVKVRRAAVKALARTKGAAAGTGLRRGLSDSDPVVRGTSASGLGAMKAKDAVPELFLALDHKVLEAAASIGQLCGADACEQLAGRLGSMPFDVISSALDQILVRPDVPEETKLKVVTKIRDIGTIEANKFLKDVQKRWPATGSKKVRAAIDEAVKSTAGGTK